MGGASGHDGSSRRIAGGSGAMGIGKQNSAFCQTIKIRRDRLRVSAHTADPVVQVVDGDKKHIGFSVVCFGFEGMEAEKYQGQKKSDTCAHERRVEGGNDSGNPGNAMLVKEVSPCRDRAFGARFGGDVARDRIE